MRGGISWNAQGTVAALRMHAQTVTPPETDNVYTYIYIDIYMHIYIYIYIYIYMYVLPTPSWVFPCREQPKVDEPTAADVNNLSTTVSF